MLGSPREYGGADIIRGRKAIGSSAKVNVRRTRARLTERRMGVAGLEGGSMKTLCHDGA